MNRNQIQTHDRLLAHRRLRVVAVGKIVRIRGRRELWITHTIPGSGAVAV